MDYTATLKKYLNILIHEGASDLHLSVGSRPIIRISGSLLPMLKEPILARVDTAGFAQVMISKERYDLFVLTQECDFAYETEDGTRFRGNLFFQRGSVSMALRLIQKKIRTLSELGLPDILLSFARKSQGFFLVVGPVGQGKTTTLAALIESINLERMELL